MKSNTKRAIVIAVSLAVVLGRGQRSAAQTIAESHKLYLPFATNAVVCQEMFTNGDFSREPRDADWPTVSSSKPWWFDFSPFCGVRVGDMWNGCLRLKPDDGGWVFAWSRGFPIARPFKLVRATLEFDWSQAFDLEHLDHKDSMSVSVSPLDYRECRDCQISAVHHSNDEDLTNFWWHVKTDITPLVGNQALSGWQVSLSADDDISDPSEWEFDNWSAQVCTRP